MTLFSERHGHKPVKTTIQTESMDDDLRNGLWNVTLRHCWKKTGRYGRQSGFQISQDFEPPVQELVCKLWEDYFKKPLDSKPDQHQHVLKEIRDYFFSCTWHDAYSFLEAVVRNLPNAVLVGHIVAECNSVLARELSGYRFVGDTITPITSDVEIAEVQSALDVTRTQPLLPVQTHLDTALRMYSDRKAPDYRNSIKESISAVEALCKLFAKSPSATLPQALDELESRGVQLHGALKSALAKMFGYASDAGGIRHALSDASNVDADDARFMLVTCSAFVNYLICKANTAGLLATRSPVPKERRND